MLRIALVGPVVLIGQLVPKPLVGQGGPPLGVVVDIGEDGAAGQSWLAMLRSRLSDSAYSAILDVKRPLTGPERRWAQLIRASTADLSAGPFAEKWGALPAALWLAAEEADSAGALRRLVVAGPPGVWKLAERRMDPTFGPVLAEIRSMAARCGPAG